MKVLNSSLGGIIIFLGIWFLFLPIFTFAAEENFPVGGSTGSPSSSAIGTTSSGGVTNLALPSAQEAAQNQENKRLEKEAEDKRKPTDVEYRQTNRTANLDKYGSFSPVESVGELAQKVLNFLLYLLGLLGLLGIIIGGGMMLFGGMDDSMLERGKEVILYSLIGVGIALLALVLTTLVLTILYSVDT